MNMRAAAPSSRWLAFCLVLVALVAHPARCDDVFNSEDRTRVEQVIGDATKAPNEGIEDVHYRLAAAKELGQTLKRGQLCKMKPLEDVPSVYHQVMVASLLDCPDVPANVKSVLQDALSGDRLVDVYFASAAAASLIERKKFTADKFDFSTVVSTLRELQSADGSFSGKIGRTRTSKQNAGLAMQIARILYDWVPSEKSATKEFAELLSHKIVDLYGLALTRQNSPGRSSPLEFVDRHGSSLVSTAAVLRGTLDLAAILKSPKDIDVSEDDMKGFATFFISNKYVSTPKAAYYLLSSLNLLADNAVSVPLMLRLANDKPLLVNPDGEEKTRRQTLQLKLTNVLDEFQSSAKVTIKKGVRGSKSNRITVNSDKALKAVGKGAKNTLYQLNFVEDLPEENEVGVYQCQFSVQRTDNKGENVGDAHLVQLPVRVSAHLNDLEFEIYSYLVSDGPSSVSDNKKTIAKHPNAASLVTLDATHHVQMNIRMKSPFDPREVLVLLQHEETKATHLFVPTKKSKRFSLRFNINSQDFEEILGGTYSLSVIVGDRNLDNSAYWQAGSIMVDSYDDEPSNEKDEWSIKDEIAWTFPDAEYQPPVFLSLAFSAIVLAPFAILIIALSSIGAFNIKIPSRAYFSSILFQIFSMVVAGWFVVYWTSLNVFVAAQGLLFLGFFLFVTGYYALKSRAYFRVQTRRKED